MRWGPLLVGERSSPFKRFVDFFKGQHLKIFSDRGGSVTG